MPACFDLALAWDDADHPFRIFVGDVGKPLVNAGVEIARFHLETVAQFFRLFAASEHFVVGQVDENRRVDGTALDCFCVYVFHDVGAESASRALIGDGTVDVPVANHDFSFVKGGNDDLP